MNRPTYRQTEVRRCSEGSQKQPGGYCARFTGREFPNAEVSYTHPYPPGPENADIRRASVEAMRRGG